MGYGTKIEWCEATFNAWWGCHKVSPGCQHCYAETLTDRWHDSEFWGRTAPRKMMSDGYWEKPRSWNDQAAAEGRIDRVFANSMSDLFEVHPDEEIQEQLNEARGRLFELIEETPHLLWLLLSKRPERMSELAPDRWAQEWPANICVMTSVENQEMAEERIPTLTKVPAHYHALSVEPLLGPVDLQLENYPIEQPVDWVIVGGESGPDARPMCIDWVRALRDQCQEAGVAFTMKQWGAWRPVPGSGAGGESPVGFWHNGYGYVERVLEEFEVGGEPWQFVRGISSGPPADYHMTKVGKKNAGRHLDGELHEEHPFTLDTESPILS